MNRNEIVKKLKGFRKEFERDGADILEVAVPVAMTLSDVCAALSLSLAEQAEVLGPKAAEVIEEWKSARLWEPVMQEVILPHPAREPAVAPAG